MDERKRKAKPVDRAVSALGLAEMAEATGIPSRTIQNDTAGITSPTLERLHAYVEALDDAGLREASNELLDAVLAPIRREARPVAQVCPDQAPAMAALHVASEAGDAVRWAEDALRDGVIDHVEASQGQKEIREARHALDELEAIAAGAAALTPQRSLLAVGGRA